MVLKVFRPRVYLILGLFFLSPVVFICLLNLLNNPKISIEGILGCLIIMLVPIWFTIQYLTIKIVLLNSSIQYHRFLKKQEIDFSEVFEISVDLNYKIVAEAGGAHVKKVIVVESKDNKLAFDFKPFSRSVMQKITLYLIEKCPKAKIDQHTIDLSNKVYVSAFRSGEMKI